MYRWGRQMVSLQPRPVGSVWKWWSGRLLSLLDVCFF
jgi:hypothetical protein